MLSIVLKKKKKQKGRKKKDSQEVTALANVLPILSCEEIKLQVKQGNISIYFPLALRCATVGKICWRTKLELHSWPLWTSWTELVLRKTNPPRREL